jgi:hypothetical protein
LVAVPSPPAPIALPFLLCDKCATRPGETRRKPDCATARPNQKMAEGREKRRVGPCGSSVHSAVRIRPAPLSWAYDITPGGVRRTGDGEASSGPPPKSRVAGAGLARRSALGWAGVGIPIGLVGFRGYAYLGAGLGPGGSTADPAAGSTRHVIAVLPSRIRRAARRTGTSRTGSREPPQNASSTPPSGAVCAAPRSRTSAPPRGDEPLPRPPPGSPVVLAPAATPVRCGRHPGR